MPHRPFTRAQSRQNARFLRALARTGNARLAAAELGVHRATYMKRRARSPRFAALWDAALAFAAAAIKTRSAHIERSRDTPSSAAETSRPRSNGGLVRRSSAPRCEGGEPLLLRLANGRVQLRRAPRGRMTKAAEQAFLAALAATCNVRLSAAAAGFTHSAFYQRARKDPGFAREWRLAEERGWEALNGGLVAGFLPDSHEDDAWRHNEPPELPAMTLSQAIQLVFLHEKSARRDIPWRRRRDESLWDAYGRALTERALEQRLRRAEDEAIARAARGERGYGEEDGEGIAGLPALDQVSNWSKADPEKRVHNAHKAMFGGWRVTDWKKRSR